MLDLETLGTAPGAVILTAAIVAFDVRGSPPKLENTFYMHVDLQSCLRVGLTVEAGTLQWWLKQGDEARREAFDHEPRYSIEQTLFKLVDFIRARAENIGTARIWSHGAGFDVVLVEEAFRRCGTGAPPWKYSNIRDTRTIYELAGIRSARTRPEVSHHAVHDAIAQAYDVQRAYEILRG